VEVEYFDGTIDEFELTAWYTMEVEPVATPEDWTGPMDNIERDDLTPVGTEMQSEHWDVPYDEEMEKTLAGPGVEDIVRLVGRWSGSVEQAPDWPVTRRGETGLIHPLDQRTHHRETTCDKSAGLPICTTAGRPQGGAQGCAP
jgi:hypothetical protein